MYCSALVLQVNLGKAWSVIWVCLGFFLEQHHNNSLGILCQDLKLNVVAMLKLLLEVL